MPIHCTHDSQHRSFGECAPRHRAHFRRSPQIGEHMPVQMTVALIGHSTAYVSHTQPVYMTFLPHAHAAANPGEGEGKD